MRYADAGKLRAREAIQVLLDSYLYHLPTKNLGADFWELFPESCSARPIPGPTIMVDPLPWHGRAFFDIDIDIVFC